MSTAGKTKEVTCITCGTVITVSLYANAKLAKCDQCKKVGKAVVENDKRAIQDGTIQKLVEQATNQNQPLVTSAPAQLSTLPTVDMDEFIHKSEHNDIIAEKIKNFKPDPTQYITIKEHKDIVEHFAKANSMGVDVSADPIKVLLQRNRSEIEGHIILNTGEIIERVPTEYKPIVNELDYLSISKISTYEQCPAKFNDGYMNTDPNEPDADGGNIFTWFGTILHEVAERMEQIYNETGIIMNPVALFDEAWKKQPLTDFGMYKEGRELIIDYFTRNPINKKTDKMISVEYEFRGQLGDAWFGCMIDYVGEINHTTGIIKDYKSNRHPFTQYQLEDSLQLSAYEVIARRLYPQYETWITGYEMFRFGWQQCPPRTKEDLDATEAYISNIWWQIKNDNVWKEKLNDYCGYCSRKMRCKKYIDFIANPKIALQMICTPDNIESANEQRKFLGSCEKIIKARKDELGNMVRAAIEMAAKNGETLVAGGKQLYLQAQSRPSYNYRGVRDIMAIHGKLHMIDDCITLNKTKMDKISKDNPQLAIDLAQCLVQSYSSPYIMERKA